MTTPTPTPPVRLSARRAIETVDVMTAEAGRLLALARREVDAVQEQWRQLGRVGGRRDDAAAALLKNVRPHLERLTEFTRRCAEQIAAVEADPFGPQDDAGGNDARTQATPPADPTPA